MEEDGVEQIRVVRPRGHFHAGAGHFVKGTREALTEGDLMEIQQLVWELEEENFLHNRVYIVEEPPALNPDRLLTIAGKEFLNVLECYKKYVSDNPGVYHTDFLTKFHNIALHAVEKEAVKNAKE